jgi:trimethylamine:corrinoid methyltransferase-like protein
MKQHRKRKGTGPQRAKRIRLAALHRATLRTLEALGLTFADLAAFDAYKRRC